MKDLIIELRKINDLTQASLAAQMGISRQTLIHIEKGTREISLSELKKFSEIFDIPTEIILDEEFSVSTKASFQKFSQKTFQKFHNLVLQCIKYGAASDGKITKTKLAKLVYLCDFASYYNFLKPISGLEYKKLAQGPVAIQFFDIIDNDESICIEIKGKAIMVSLNEAPQNSLLNSEEQKIIKKICNKWKNANTQEIVEFTHKQTPWKICRDGEAIPYTLINSEAPENVY